MRSTLIGSLVEVLRVNLARKAPRLRVFEIGKVFLPPPTGQQLPDEREVILYCNCPSEASAARIARLLMDRGVRSVRPLAGGLQAWLDAGFKAGYVAALIARRATKPTSVSTVAPSSAAGFPTRPATTA